MLELCFCILHKLPCVDHCHCEKFRFFLTLSYTCIEREKGEVSFLNNFYNDVDIKIFVIDNENILLGNQCFTKFSKEKREIMTLLIDRYMDQDVKERKRLLLF